MDCGLYTDGLHRFGDLDMCRCGVARLQRDSGDEHLGVHIAYPTPPPTMDSTPSRRDRDLHEDEAVLKQEVETGRGKRVSSVPDALAKLGDIYRERNAIYGDSYKNFGKVMRGFFPRPITLDTEEDWNRMALFFHCADKLARTAAALPGGVHVDSLDDNSVYSQMLQEYDALAKEATYVKKG